MGLIKCIDCGKEVSDRITNCPHCGSPLEFSKPKEEEKVIAEKVEVKIDDNNGNKKKPGKKVFFIIIIAVILFL